MLVHTHRLVKLKHEFDRLGLVLGLLLVLGLWLGLCIASGLWLGLWLIKIKVYVKPFCLAAKPKSRDNFWASELVTTNGNNTKPKRRKINCQTQIQANSKLYYILI